MRRKDREMSEEFALKVIDQSEFGVLGLGGEEPYTIPLSIVREEKSLYFHSARSGKKVELIKDGDKVSISFVSRVHVPKILDRDGIIKNIEEEKFGEIGSKVFTTEFSSAHVLGRIYKVTEREEIISALLLIAKKYTEEVSDLALGFIENSFDRTSVYRIEIDEIKGKRKKFDKDGVEMKFQRME